MNITEFAEQIVFGKTLEEKVMAPGRLQYDSARQSSLSSSVTPGRPTGMEMQLPVSYTHLTLPTKA